jgi:type IV secretion system protein VirB9
MRTRLTPMVLLIVAAGSLMAARTTAAQTAGIREVTVNDRNLIPLNTRMRYTTMIVLPDGDEILDVICGDRDFWVISAAQNVAHVKPAKADAETNLNLVTAKGTIYSFLLKEKGGAAQPDLKIYVNADPSTPSVRQKYYSASDVEKLNAELTEAREAVTRSEQRAREAVAAANEQYPSRLSFPYGAIKCQRPFYIRAIWHDGEFTYLKADARELPALYEMKDGKPSVLNFQVRNGVYVVPKVLERGYLALGDARFNFEQREP